MKTHKPKRHITEITAHKRKGPYRRRPITPPPPNRNDTCIPLYTLCRRQPK